MDDSTFFPHAQEFHLSLRVVDLARSTAFAATGWCERAAIRMWQARHAGRIYGVIATFSTPSRWCANRS